MRHPGFRLGALWRLSCTAQRRGWRVIPGLIRQLALGLFGCDLSPLAEVAPGIKIPHPVGVVVGDRVVIHEGVTLMQNTTLGGNFGRTVGGRMVPTLGPGVFVGPGAGVFGPVEITKGAVLGANTVTTRDV